MKEALEARIKDDKEFAKSQRWKYDDNAWKHSWEGAQLSELYKKWGAPTRSFADGDGGQVAVYENVSVYSGGSYTPGYIETAINGFGQTVITDQKNAKDTRWTKVYVRETTVYTNRNGLITKVDEHYK
ncbi:hypothetical protein [Taibaiella koreensis]|uniref:hypothetical protein n=1 Tax=Taibaiella koreensis TaxID=1268548 RepID=UPI0013C35F55|nr:hypothetical protein [Taibaiella koreensis]